MVGQLQLSQKAGNENPTGNLYKKTHRRAIFRNYQAHAMTVLPNRPDMM
jgi:hypothetical protein